MKTIQKKLCFNLFQIHELWAQFNNMTTQDLMKQHEYLRSHVLQHPENIIRQGMTLVLLGCFVYNSKESLNNNLYLFPITVP